MSPRQPLPALPGEEAETKAEHPAELVERVAKAIYEAKYGTTRSWSELSEEKQYDFERYAEAALSAIPRPAAPTELPETKPTAWQRLGEFLAHADLGPERSWEKHEGQLGAVVYLFEGDDMAAAGEGPTLDAALVAAMEKLK